MLLLLRKADSSIIAQREKCWSPLAEISSSKAGKNHKYWDRDHIANCWPCELSSPALTLTSAPSPNSFERGVWYDLSSAKFVN